MKNNLKCRDTAWRFLRKNPNYRTDWKSILPFANRPKIQATIPLYAQSHSDVSAQKWGLFAYEDPNDFGDLISPFWSEAPTLEAEIAPGGTPALLPMLRKAEARVMGLLLLDGDLILKVERDNDAVQVRIKNGHTFNETCGLILNLPLNLGLPAQLSHAQNLWGIASGKRVKKVIFAIPRILTNFFLSWMASWQVAHIAR